MNENSKLYLKKRAALAKKFCVADHNITIALSFIFRYVTPSIIKMCYLRQLQNVSDTLLVSMFKVQIWHHSYH